MSQTTQSNKYSIKILPDRRYRGITNEDMPYTHGFQFRDSFVLLMHQSWGSMHGYVLAPGFKPAYYSVNHRNTATFLAIAPGAEGLYRWTTIRRLTESELAAFNGRTYQQEEILKSVR